MGTNFNFDDVKISHANGELHRKPSPCCSECGQKASIFVSQVDAQGKVTKKNFCLFHAIKENLFHPKAWDLLGTGKALHQHSPAVLTCNCGMTAHLLKAKGKVGCAQCYTTFANFLKPLLPKLHNATAHAGKAPQKAAPTVNVRRKIEALKMALDRAIKKEAYEQAAQMRDQLLELESTTK